MSSVQYFVSLTYSLFSFFFFLLLCFYLCLKRGCLREQRGPMLNWVVLPDSRDACEHRELPFFFICLFKRKRLASREHLLSLLFFKLCICFLCVLVHACECVQYGLARLASLLRTLISVTSYYKAYKRKIRDRVIRRTLCLRNPYQRCSPCERISAKGVSICESA